MAQIYDNIKTSFTEGLKAIISNSQVKRADFCVGYFNLRGWEHIVEDIDRLKGDFVYENDESVHRTCRLLVGMQRPGIDLIKLYMDLKNNRVPDSDEVQNYSSLFRKQLLNLLHDSQHHRNIQKDYYKNYF